MNNEPTIESLQAEGRLQLTPTLNKDGRSYVWTSFCSAHQSFDLSCERCISGIWTEYVYETGQAQEIATLKAGIADIVGIAANSEGVIGLADHSGVITWDEALTYLPSFTEAEKL